ncbi:hypothetical protein LIER_21912 [Lithospermum erythrorhizon]|uniref:CCHC-type domain-containing protein n=1 Tax=Lithospermum erythrorhizon TaxID=34254 RepID=A0AAV3QV31_LITER
MSPELSKGFMYVRTIGQFWRELEERFWKSNGPKIYDLRRGLNEEYDAIRNQILLKEPLPTLSRTYDMIVQVEDTNSIRTMLTGSIDNAAMQVKTQFDPRKKNYGQSFGFAGNRSGAGSRFDKVDKTLLKCEYCGEKGHLKSDCFKLVGFPD